MNPDTHRSPEPPDGSPPGTQEDRARPGVFLGSFLDIRFYLDYSWFFIVALVIYSLSSFFFPHELSGRDPAVYIAMGVVAALLFFLSILLHELGHSVGDEALKALAVVVGKTLRPTDVVARYGGEEFVVLLPGTPVEEGQQILTRLQRSLTGGLFLHEQRNVLVTFSAGVTAYRDGERIEEALERADQGLYEAKRSGKNRTCLA